MGQRATLCEMRVGVELASQCPRLDYLVDFPAKGKYTIWMRSRGPHPNGDSIYFGLDMQTNNRSLFHTGNGKLQWQRHRDWTFEVDNPGLHTVNVWMREDGAAFDRLIITSDQSMSMGDAASEGPAESGRAPATASK